MWKTVHNTWETCEILKPHQASVVNYNNICPKQQHKLPVLRLSVPVPGTNRSELIYWSYRESIRDLHIQCPENKPLGSRQLWSQDKVLCGFTVLTLFIIVNLKTSTAEHMPQFIRMLKFFITRLPKWYPKLRRHLVEIYAFY